MEVIDRSRELIVLIYGLGGHPLFTRVLANRLRRRGYSVFDWRYSSLRYSIQHHSEQLVTVIQELQRNPNFDKVHIVAHSMGAIIARSMLSKLGNKEKLSRLVMIAPPNQGSYWATIFAPILKWCVPILGEISTRDDSTCRNLPMTIPMEFGVIVARFDHLVVRSRTSLETMADSIIVNGTHTNILFSMALERQIDHFLKHGLFQHEPRTK